MFRFLTKIELIILFFVQNMFHFLNSKICVIMLLFFGICLLICYNAFCGILNTMKWPVCSTDSGSVYAAGLNDCGQLGVADGSKSYTIVRYLVLLFMLCPFDFHGLVA